MSKPTVKIENWRIFKYGDHLRLSGEVLDHPRFDPGISVTTSKIEGVHCEFVETRNTIYHLGYQSTR